MKYAQAIIFTAAATATLVSAAPAQRRQQNQLRGFNSLSARELQDLKDFLVRRGNFVSNSRKELDDLTQGLERERSRAEAARKAARKAAKDAKAPKTSANAPRPQRQRRDFDEELGDYLVRRDLDLAELD